MAMGARIQERLDELGWEQVDLLGRVPDLSAGTLSALIKRDSQRSGYSEAIAEALGVQHLWLFKGEGPKLRDGFDANVAPASPATRSVPLISYVQAGHWTEASDPFAPGAAQDFVPTDTVVSRSAFALVIKGESMLPDFHPGDKVIIDPAVQPRPGDFVVAKNGEEEATFKKYRPRGVDERGNEVFELVPLNDDYPTIRSDRTPMRIVGTMVERRHFRRR